MKNVNKCFLFLLFIFSCSTVACAQQKKLPPGGPVSPQTALWNYLSQEDSTYRWELKGSYADQDLTVYTLLLTSQQWRTYTWKHQLNIMVPRELNTDAALLYITGGSINNEGLPNWASSGNLEMRAFAEIARQQKAVTAVLKQVPNQPLFKGYTEDALISYTLHQFKQDHDYSWPLLFPMVKSAQKAMDAIQEFSTQRLHHRLKRFVVSGASKRGWTTWLTGASDSRVVAIAPMVIDMLNMRVSMNYQLKVWKDYSVQIEDYVKLGLVQDIGSTEGNALTTMIDPYAYRKLLTMPKMIIMGTNDEYWPVDNIKNYLDSIPGHNMIHYIPNVGHSLGNGAEAMATLSAFFGYALSKSSYPICRWESSVSDQQVRLQLKASGDRLTDVIVWQANSTDTDFRNDQWSSRHLDFKGKSDFVVNEALPESGYKAFYVNLQYTSPTGAVYTESTRVFMTDTHQIL